jgi:hypothetical protein
MLIAIIAPQGEKGHIGRQLVPLGTVENFKLQDITPAADQDIACSDSS